ncbi:histone H2A deubiquitinase MYSM1-like [Rhynchophorus ferrugineus]|uniref:Myb-like, SWIRM and MPN domain-containing protein 1 n=1 Tax=Rhynchophorus ferrugineus TaxID=354439 RepID=A0A834IJQ5_RHYFE|nr:hypothetical protein GWI33_007595 [Rhynchophorus ferrugineus]
MADDDEIDILGDFTLNNLGPDHDTNMLDSTLLVSENSEILNCDYTIHPQWLLDKPSANPDNWYDSNSASSAVDIQETDSLGQISTEDCITDESGWTEKEKSLLHRGIEIFGKSSVRLSQFVGSKTSSEVKYYLKNYFSENQKLYDQNSSECQVVTDILNSDQIPASIEEVIAVVSTGSPTVDDTHKKVKKRTTSLSTGNVTDIFKKNQQLFEKNKVLKKCKKSPVAFQKFKKSFDFKHKPKIKYDIGSQRRCSSEDNVKIISKAEITTGKGLGVPICEGEEIIKIENAEDDLSDISIDIENDGYNVSMLSGVPKPDVPTAKEILDVKHKEEDNTVLLDSMVVNNHPEKIPEELLSLEQPTTEIILDDQIPNDLEKFVHGEFFEGRPLKTPERYLKIRNHIINNWRTSKPNYINKTSMRMGLKNCGDVTCISRIHYFLEQIGAINFGCAQTKYDRPLYDFLRFSGVPRERPLKKQKHRSTRDVGALGPRQRFKKKFNNDGEGGYTLTHGEQGQIINTTIVNEEPPRPKAYAKKPPIQLIYCRPFTPDNPQKYTVKLNLATLLLMDLHAHAYLTEIMGLVGGSWDAQRRILNISIYEPCKNMASSSTHCDMCPISQAKAAERIHNAHLDILGWFHSHPTFAPEPSQQDLDTQQMVQQWIGHNKPCVGVILSPFSSNGALISSPFRCLVVDKTQDQIIPFRLNVEVDGDVFDLPRFGTDLRRMFYLEHGYPKDKRLQFDKPYFQDSSITHMEKFLFSINMHLAKYTTPCQRTKEDIVGFVKDMLTSKTTS